MRFAEWYKLRNPDLDPRMDALLEEVQSAYEAGYKEALMVEHELNHLEKLGQDFDDDHKP